MSGWSSINDIEPSSCRWSQTQNKLIVGLRGAALVRNYKNVYIITTPCKIRELPSDPYDLAPLTVFARSTTYNLSFEGNLIYETFHPSLEEAIENQVKIVNEPFPLANLEWKPRFLRQRSNPSSGENVLEVVRCRTCDKRREPRWKDIFLRTQAK